MGEQWGDVGALRGGCRVCGLDPTGTPERDLGPAIVADSQRWFDWLHSVSEDPGGDDWLARPPQPDVWSPLQYCGHVRDLLAVFTNRLVRLALDPAAADECWDGAAAAAEGRYQDLHPGTVASDLRRNAQEFAALAQRRLNAPDRAVATLELVRLVHHEVHHHLADASCAVLPLAS